jgi:GT2 family glycosyltransferase
MMLPFVSVIIVNYNGRDLLAECLDSLAQQTYPRHRLEAILVDNASHDDSVRFVRDSYPWVRLIQLDSNVGFAKANNIALEQARGVWIALLNSDAAANPDWLHTAVSAGSQSRNMGGVASRLVFRDRPDVVNGTALEIRRDGRGADRDFGRPLTQLKRPFGEVFGGCGAALVLRRSMLDAIGLFDSNLFMYYEDLELAWRGQRSGWKFVYEPDARVRHVFGASTGISSPFQTRFVERNRVLVNMLHAPIWLAVMTFIGCIARCCRTALRYMKRQRSIRWQHVTGHLWALASVFALMPRTLLDRHRLNAEFGCSDTIYRRWAQK